MTSTPINPTDIAVLAILFLSAILAFARGFVREALSVLAWVGAGTAAWYAYPHVQPLVRQYVASDAVANGVAAAGTFLVVLILLSIVASRIAGSVRGSALSAVDRSLGFLFGLLRGAVLVCLGYVLLTMVYPDPVDHPAWVREARTMPAIQNGAERLKRLVPDRGRTEAQERAAAAVESARVRAVRAAEEEALKRLSSPVPHAAKASVSGSEPGYKLQERSGLDRLIESSKPAP
jgi:membrane protein required for colicin V production